MGESGLKWSMHLGFVVMHIAWNLLINTVQLIKHLFDNTIIWIST